MDCTVSLRCVHRLDESLDFSTCRTKIAMWLIPTFCNSVSAVQRRAPWSSTSCCEFVWERWRQSNLHTKALHDSDFSCFSLLLILSRWLSRCHPSLACSSCFLSVLFFNIFSPSLPPSLSHSSSPLAGLLWFHLSCLTCSCRPYKLTCLPSLWTPALVGRPNNTIIFCTNYLTPTTGSISQLFSPHTHTHTHTHTQTGIRQTAGPNAARIHMHTLTAYMYLLASHKHGCRVHHSSVKYDMHIYIHPQMHPLQSNAPMWTPVV